MLGAALAVVVVLFIVWQKLYVNDKANFLVPSSDAQWIIEAKPYSPDLQTSAQNIGFFRTTFKTASPQQNIVLNARAFKLFRLFIDDQLMFESPENIRGWKKEYELTLPHLDAGHHELVAMVLNNNGPPAFLLYSEQLNLSTDTSWEFRPTGGGWGNAGLATERKHSEISSKYPVTYSALISTIQYGLLLLVLFIGFAKYYRGIKNFADLELLRFFLFFAWFLYLTGFLINPKVMGFDYVGHIEYIDYVAANWRIPFAQDGWEMFQSPLYYMVSAILLTLLKLIFSDHTSYNLLVLLPLFCILAQIEIGYRCARYAFPTNNFAQLTTLGFCGLAPLNLYMSQFVGNAVFTSAITAWIVLLTLRSIKEPGYLISVQGKFLFGIGIGLALLSKVTPILLIPPVLVALVTSMAKSKQEAKQVMLSVATNGVTIFLISGWYYIRNWLHMGKVFIGGWDSSRGIMWWQEPGFRTWHDFMDFGASLTHPIYSATYGFWDSLYSTFWLDGLLGSVANFQQALPWNVEFMITLALLSLLPTLGLLLGSFFTFKKVLAGDSSPVLMFCLGVIAIYFAAMLYYYVDSPATSAAKSGYTLEILPCFGILTAYGLDKMAKFRRAKLTVSALMVWWGGFSYIAFFPH